ncbi:hypothetical protein RRG08_007461 [Elysia crispata]|uniref:Uncharacterized protein n=1 Tax=Elysia crispata TaxID=231223 RepID=A0AAE0XN25_9GAST|nr:hypothetical protein RRG08_007461 [Elysia crispata]
MCTEIRTEGSDDIGSKSENASRKKTGWSVSTFHRAVAETDTHKHTAGAGMRLTKPKLIWTKSFYVWDFSGN